MNWFFMLLSFLLGAGLTWLWTVRSVTRDVPIYAGAGAAATGPAGFVGLDDGSVWADADGRGPEGWTVKADDETMQYAVRGSAEFDRLYAQVWFPDEDTARRAGYSAQVTQPR